MAFSAAALMIVPAAALGVPGDFTPASTSPEPAGDGPTSIVAANLNGDASIDLAVANGYSDDVTILLGDGSGDFTPAPTSPEPVGVHPTSVAVTHLLPEPNADLVVANGGSDNVSILLGAGGGDFTPAPTSPEAVGDGPTSIVTSCGTINECASRVFNLLITNGGDDSIEILSGNFSNTDFSASPPVPVGVAPTSLFSLSLPGVFYDSYGYDVAVANGGSDNVTILSGVTPAPTSPEAVGSHPTSIVTGNLNGNATIGDLAVANGDSDNVTILLNDVVLPPALPPALPAAQAAPTGNPVQLKKCIKRAKKKHKNKLGQKKAVKKCMKRFG